MFRMRWLALALVFGMATTVRAQSTQDTARAKAAMTRAGTQHPGVRKAKTKTKTAKTTHKTTAKTTHKASANTVHKSLAKTKTGTASSGAHGKRVAKAHTRSASHTKSAKHSSRTRAKTKAKADSSGKKG